MDVMPKKPELERFMEKTRLDGKPHRLLGTPCLLWTGSLRDNGYGQFYFRGQAAEKAHRVSWVLHRGKIPDGISVLHRCDVPACVNPEHLFLGTIADNNRDMSEKGRRVPPPRYLGVSHPNAKLTPAKVREMRRLHQAKVPLSQICKRFGVSKSGAWHVLARESWAHVR
jgi:hypothetical protein